MGGLQGYHYLSVGRYTDDLYSAVSDGQTFQFTVLRDI